MLNAGAFSSFNSTSLLSPNKNQFSITGPLSTFNFTNASFLFSSQHTQQTHLSFRRRDNGLLLLLRVSASKIKRRKGDTAGMEMDDSHFDDDDDGDDEDAGMFLPLGKMKSWLENRPRGFGEGKMYDTSVEDKLLEEIEQSRRAQMANINKLKHDPTKGSPKEDDGKKKVPEVTPNGIRVRLVNLPKKKNIHRDLKSAFEGVPGIINISPAVSGNKKTKDPICKGFAFVDFKSEEDATRFVQIFSRQSISFGKIQKQIKCELMNSNSPKSLNERPAGNTYNDPELTVTADSTYSDPELTVPALEEDTDANFNEDDNSSDSCMEAASNGTDPVNELDSAKWEDIRENLEFLSVSELNDDDITKHNKSSTDLFSSNQRKKIQVIEKKIIAKGKVKKVPKLEVPGSAKRLKVKEKAVLTDVFSKYAVKAASASKEEN